METFRSASEIILTVSVLALMLEYLKMYREGIRAGIVRKRTPRDKIGTLILIFLGVASLLYFFGNDEKRVATISKAIFCLGSTGFLLQYLKLYRKGANLGIFKKRRQIPTLTAFVCFFIVLIVLPLVALFVFRGH